MIIGSTHDVQPKDISPDQPLIRLIRASRNFFQSAPLAHTLCLVVLLMLVAPAPGRAEMVSVNRPKINMRSGPGTQYGVMWELGRGYPLKVLGRQGNWLKVIDFENDTGWIYKPLVSHRAYLIVKKPVVNIRSGPGTGYRLIGKANYGVVLRTVSRSRSWVKIRHENGLTGWVKRSLLWGW